MTRERTQTRPLTAAKALVPRLLPHSRDRPVNLFKFYCLHSGIGCCVALHAFHSRILFTANHVLLPLRVRAAI
jgi:hypothetical protein